MICSNCYTGCAQIYSDKCIKYTGTDNEILGFNSGDSLLFITNAIVNALTTTLNGTGIQYEIEDMCETITQYLPVGTNLNVVDITTALAKGLCSIDEQIAEIVDLLATQEAGYTLGCISEESIVGTHNVLQATINAVCDLSSAISSINLNLETNYVAIEDIDNFIAAYLEEQTSGEITGHASKMVPYTVVEYYGTLSNFDATGAGIGDWASIYLCNGNNNTPDKRGRVGVGTTTAMGGGALSISVDPAYPGNPSYALKDLYGSNTVTLSVAQLPVHTHPVTINEGGAHSHTLPPLYSLGGTSDDEVLSYASTRDNIVVTETNAVDPHTHTATVGSIGEGVAHSNIQPVLACHYIMYIPQ